MRILSCTFWPVREFFPGVFPAADSRPQPDRGRRRSRPHRPPDPRGGLFAPCAALDRRTPRARRPPSANRPSSPAAPRPVRSGHAARQDRPQFIHVSQPLAACATSAMIRSSVTCERMLRACGLRACSRFSEGSPPSASAGTKPYMVSRIKGAEFGQSARTVADRRYR